MKKINMVHNFIDTAQKKPERTAVLEIDKSISFSGLLNFANNIAVEIVSMTDSSVCTPVGIYIGKNINSVASDLAVLLSGNFYFNFDVKTPAERNKNVVDLVKPSCVLTVRSEIEKLSAFFDVSKAICVDEINQDEQKQLCEQWQKTIDTDPMCIIATSGSTGIPKGVVLNHRSFFDFVSWALETTGIKEDEVMASLSPIGFDIFTYEMCHMITTGSTLAIMPDMFAAFPVKLLNYMQEIKTTYLFWVPTIMVNISNMDLLAKIPLPDLHMVWFAGEVLPTKHLNYWRKNLPQARFINLYGPIEITLDCTYYIIDRELSDDEPIPIGFPCRNTDILVLNEHNELVKPGEEGELCVRGTALAMGYYNNPEKTKEAFVQNPLNAAYPETIYRTGDVAAYNERGEIVFKGRRDTLVKHSGYRIELSEIEHIVVNTLKIVQNGCAIYDYSKKEIVLVYEPLNDMTVADMKKAIGACVPKYMIPNTFIKIDEMPMNNSGKIDRLKLKGMIL